MQLDAHEGLGRAGVAMDMALRIHHFEGAGPDDLRQHGIQKLHRKNPRLAGGLGVSVQSFAPWVAVLGRAGGKLAARLRCDNA